MTEQKAKEVCTCHGEPYTINSHCHVCGKYRPCYCPECMDSVPTTEQENIRKLAIWLWGDIAMIPVKHWNPFADDAQGLWAARMLIREAQKRGWHYEVGDNHIKEEYYCFLYRTDREDRKEVWGYGTTEEHAICQAVLRMIGGEKEMNIQTARGIAARIWYDAEYSHIIMDPAKCEQIAVILKDIANNQMKER